MGQSFEIAVTLLVFETRAVSRESIHQHHTVEMYLIMLFRLDFQSMWNSCWNNNKFSS
jgi:hypothetical protein